MPINITYAECLKALLSTLNISMSRLSKAINVDNSLISRWIHGKRIPPYGTSYIEKIAEYLAKNASSTYHREQLEHLLINLSGDIHVECNNYVSAIKKILLEAQCYSMETRKLEKRERKNTSSISNQDLKPVFIYETELKSFDSSSSGHINSPLHTFNLSEKDKIIYGLDNIMSQFISLLEYAQNHKGSEGDSIYITYSDFEPTTIDYSKLNIMKNLLFNAIQNGWTIVFLININISSSNITIFTQLMLSLISTGKIKIHYFNKYEIISSLGLQFLVTGVGALCCFTTIPYTLINCGIYFNNKNAIDIIKDYIHVLITTQSHRLIQSYSKDTYGYYWDSLTRSLEIKGNQFHYNCNFSMIFLPEKLYEKLLVRAKKNPEEIKLSMEYYKRQLKAITKNLEVHIIKEIFFAESMENLLNHQYLYLYTYQGIEKVKLEIPEIIAFIENAISFFKKYKNFQLAVIYADNTQFKKYCECNFILKERQGIYFNILKPTAHASEIRFSINEPIFLRVFKDYFLDLWTQICPINKDSEETISWLEGKLEILKMKNNCHSDTMSLSF